MIAVIYGTRPEIIKLSPLIRLAKAKKLDLVTVYTGQHFSPNMKEVFFDNLSLPEPDYTLDVGSKSHAVMVAEAMIGIEKILIKINPDIVLVQGDTNSALAGALVAAKLGIKVGHIEAGLRSFDRRMPEELNRIMIDHLSDLLFAPTNIAADYLLKEGIQKANIFVVGNTIADALAYALKKIGSPDLPLSLNPKEYFLATLHRQENVDDHLILQDFIALFQSISSRYHQRIILPMHPRTLTLIKKFALNTAGLDIIDPQDYFSFLNLLNNARLVLTDSGGIQEESCILGIPCLTLRDNTERPETLNIQSNILVGHDQDKAMQAVDYFEKERPVWVSPYGDGKTAERILSVL